jgi:hypothetical protein
VTEFHRGAKVAPKQTEMDCPEMVACFTHWMAIHHPEVTTPELLGLVQAAHPIALNRRAISPGAMR